MKDNEEMFSCHELVYVNIVGQLTLFGWIVVISMLALVSTAMLGDEVGQLALRDS